MNTQKSTIKVFIGGLIIGLITGALITLAIYGNIMLALLTK